MYITRLIYATIEYTWDDVIAFRRDLKITASTDVACAHEPCRHIVQTTSDLFSGRQISFFFSHFRTKALLPFTTCCERVFFLFFLFFFVLVFCCFSLTKKKILDIDLALTFNKRC